MEARQANDYEQGDEGRGVGWWTSGDSFSLLKQTRVSVKQMITQCNFHVSSINGRIWREKKQEILQQQEGWEDKCEWNRIFLGFYPRISIPSLSLSLSLLIVHYSVLLCMQS